MARLVRHSRSRLSIGRRIELILHGKGMKDKQALVAIGRVKDIFQRTEKVYTVTKTDFMWYDLSLIYEQSEYRI